MAQRRTISFLTAVSNQKTGSTENTLMLTSTSTVDLFEQTGELKEVTIQDSKAVVEEIVDKIFDDQKGLSKHGLPLSSSQCSIPQGRDMLGSLEMDRRLKHWHKTLNERKEMQCKIHKKTGKRPDEMLFNRASSLEHRDKGNVQRLLDYATRMKPEAVKSRNAAVLPEYFDQQQCMQIKELKETLPKPERDGKATVEIIGLSKVTRKEILGPSEASAQKSNSRPDWLKSKALEKRIEDQMNDIEQVIEFYPETENLEVIGTNPLKLMNIQHDKDIELVSMVTMHNVSNTTDETSEDEQVAEYESPKEQPEQISVGVKINDEIFLIKDKRCSQLVDLNVFFECEPYTRELKQVLRIENIGKQVISCIWQNPEFYKRHPQFLNSVDDTFLFDCASFALSPGDVHVSKVVFQPRCVCVVKQRWELKIFPHVFCNRRDTLLLQLHGKCVPPPEFVLKTDFEQSYVLDKSNKRAMDKLAAQQATLVPLIQPHEVMCPYQREFDEREIFNAQNNGYHCERFDDLELLKVLYNSIKKPREPQWDFHLDSIKKVIMRLPEAEQRESYFEQLVQALEPLQRCRGGLPNGRFDHNAERDRSRFIYVRGVISNGIEEWEDLVMSLEQTSLKLELGRFYAQLEQNDDSGREIASEDEEPKPWLRQLKNKCPELYVLKKLRGKKFYRDTMYMHTYTHLCDMAEDMVSVIESTENV